jgi:Holliday junction resolvase-like predicted endonuclease
MFEDDKIRGNKGEEIAMRYLKERQGALAVFKLEIYYPEFDMICVLPRGKVRLVECKSDCMEAKTGNIAIEYKSRNVLSGILVSTADWYVIVLKEKLICLKHRDLLYFLRENQFREIDGAGDNSQIILVPTDLLVSAVDENNKLICDVWYYNKHEEHKKIGYLHEIV